MKPLGAETPSLPEVLEAFERVLILNKDAILAYRDAFSKEEQKKFKHAFGRFHVAAAILLGDILAREQRGEISTAEYEALITAFAVACSAYSETRIVGREAFGRLKAKLGTHKARSARASDSADVDEVVEKLMLEARVKNPALRTARSTASAIVARVNADLKQHNPELANQNVETIRKRVARLQKKRRP